VAHGCLVRLKGARLTYTTSCTSAKTIMRARGMHGASWQFRSNGGIEADHLR
jgi:hypothetical protein